MAQGAATREASPDMEHQAQTAVPQSNYRALDVFHWFISIWQDLKSQGHKTQSYYFISGKCTMTSLERCPFVSRGRAQSREHKCRIPNKCIPQPSLPGHSTAPSSSQCWNVQHEHPQTANINGCSALHRRMKSTEILSWAKHAQLFISKLIVSVLSEMYFSFVF